MWWIFKLSACSWRQINNCSKQTVKWTKDYEITTKKHDTKLRTESNLYVFISMLRSFHLLNLYSICMFADICTCLLVSTAHEWITHIMWVWNVRNKNTFCKGKASWRTWESPSENSCHQMLNNFWRLSVRSQFLCSQEKIQIRESTN